MGDRVCHISTVHSAFDDRIFYKECKTLAEAGYDVYLIVTHNKREFVNGVHIIPLPQGKGRFYRFFVKDWIALIKAIRLNAKIYHFHDPELIFIGIILKILGKRIIYDVHELVYFQIEDKQFLKYEIIKHFARSLYIFFEFLSIKLFDKLILAEDSYKGYFCRRYGNLNKYVVIRNFPVIALIQNAKPIMNFSSINQKFIIIYAGGLTRIRGIKEIIKSLSYLEGKAELWLLGKWESNSFEKECRSLDSWKYVKYLGFKLLNEVYGYMKVASIGIALLYPIKNYLGSLPVKSFEYMACGIPIVMSDFPYWKELFKEYALFANPKDPRDIADKIKVFMNNEELRAEMGKAGILAVRNAYSWEAESRRLINLYSSILKQKAR